MCALCNMQVLSVLAILNCSYMYYVDHMYLFVWFSSIIIDDLPPMYIHSIYYILQYTIKSAQIISTASATINDDNMATVTVSGLRCAETYAITAGGIITTDGMVGQTLDGPRFNTEIIVASVCPTIQTTTMLSSKEFIYHLVSTC